MGGPASSFDKNMSCLIGLIESDLRLHSMQNRAAPYKNSIVIFVERKITSNYIALFLQQMGYHFEPLNSDYLVEDNKRTLARLMNREIQGVVATNKLSRGQDIPDLLEFVDCLEAVIGVGPRDSAFYQDFAQYMLTKNIMSDGDETATYRIGRTGRMGNGGRATVMLSLSNDCMHVVPLVDFMVHHNQIIPQWLYDAYLTIKEGEQRQQLSAHSDSFVSAEQEISEEDDDCIGEDVIMARI
ncbi:unnamed protein product [Heligmosomoides polygyrus]|uniref:Helicase C-terminal domain-containing protein n=1 Tax=Heligmosomoides polygyrus TaxID=6339 RepID=A0A183G1T5_HELPZ|nr:unnamed protein product [Heligmosomoides polygyrus]